MKIKTHICQWEFRTDSGEEEHGKYTSIRFCNICNRKLNLLYQEFGNIKFTWEDEIKPESIKLP